MADVIASAEIRIWQHLVGGVVELDDGQIAFEYAEGFRTSGLDISPLKLPFRLRRPVQFAELREKEAFRGLPGLLADALPDAFGKSVMRAYYTSRGQLERALSPVQHLLYVGERALGALTFHPAEELPTRAEAEALEVGRLVADATADRPGRGGRDDPRDLPNRLLCGWDATQGRGPLQRFEPRGAVRVCGFTPW